MNVNDRFVLTGSTDGFIRVWRADSESESVAASPRERKHVVVGPEKEGWLVRRGKGVMTSSQKKLLFQLTNQKDGFGRLYYRKVTDHFCRSFASVLLCLLCVCVCACHTCFVGIHSTCRMPMQYRLLLSCSRLHSYRLRAARRCFR